MTVFNWLTLFGVPTFCVGTIVFVFKWFKAIGKGIQAILRDRLNQQYMYCADKGSASISERDNWVNMYDQYHNLGANGVMDDTKAKFLALPISREE